jgi:hypothetical protein
VTCTVFDPYAFLSYDDYYGNDAASDEITPTTVTCIGNALSPFKLDCQEGMQTSIFVTYIKNVVLNLLMFAR